MYMYRGDVCIGADYMYIRRWCVQSVDYTCRCRLYPFSAQKDKSRQMLSICRQCVACNVRFSVNRRCLPCFRCCLPCFRPYAVCGNRRCLPCLPCFRPYAVCGNRRCLPCLPCFRCRCLPCLLTLLSPPKTSHFRSAFL